MSQKHPIIAVTGSSGSGTSALQQAFSKIFERQALTAAWVSGDCFHRYEREEMQKFSDNPDTENHTITHFSPHGNIFDKLQALFDEYSKTGTGTYRHYIHDEQDAKKYHYPIGSLTPWEPLPINTDLLFYEGLHGGLVTEQHDIRKYVDLLIGVAPVMNLEWIQKIHRDEKVRGYSTTQTIKVILERMQDYAHYILPQFSRTDINFQRIPIVDVSNPFNVKEVPDNTKSMSVIHIKNREKLSPDFDYLLKSITGSFMSDTDTIVVPSIKKELAGELILAPVIKNLFLS